MNTLLIARIIITALAVLMALFTLPAYLDPVTNPGLATLTGEALSLGNTAGAFLGRQLTVIIIALIGAFVGHRYLVAMGGFGLAFMNGHDTFFMGLFGGSTFAAGAGAVIAILGILVIVLALRTPEKTSD